MPEYQKLLDSYITIKQLNEMTNEFVLEAITREFPDSVISSSEPYGMLTLK
jgi:predicted glycosyltransferase